MTSREWTVSIPVSYEDGTTGFESVPISEFMKRYEGRNHAEILSRGWQFSEDNKPCAECEKGKSK